MLAQLTFHEELWKGVVDSFAGGLSTAILVTVLGTVAANRWSKRRDERQARFELRTKLIERSAQIAQRMYTACQHAYRIRDGAAEGEGDDPALEPLDTEYFDFAVASPALEYELGARYGFDNVMARDLVLARRLLVWDRAQATAQPIVGSRVRERWHQVRDLLTVYYFQIKNEFPGNILERNSTSADGTFHAGLDFAMYLNDPERIVHLIRRSYEEAMRELVQAMMRDRIEIG